MRLIRLLLPILSTIVFPGLISSGRIILAQESGQVRVAGSVPKATFLALGTGTAERFRVIDTDGSRSIHVRINRGQGREAMLELVARSNVSYRLSVENPQRAGIRLVRTLPASGGGRVLSGAVDLRETSKSESEITFEGQRISRGGNNSTPNNALLVQLQVTLPAESQDSDLTIRMQPLP